MWIKGLKDSQPFRSGDKAVLRELLHPAKSPLDVRYSLAHALVKSGTSTQPHALKTSEVYYILKGLGIMHIGPETAEIRAGQAVYIPPGSTQFIENTGSSDLEFLCIVDPAWRPEDEEIF